MNKKNNSYSEYRKNRSDSSKKNPDSSKKRSDSKEYPKTSRTPSSSANYPKKRSKKTQKKRTSEPKKLTREEKLRNKAARSSARKEKMTDVINSAWAALKKLGAVLFFFILLAEVMMMINLNARIDTAKFENNDLTKQLEKKKEIVKELNSQREAAYKSETIENLAKYKLGMVYPSKDQTIYINLD